MSDIRDEVRERYAEAARSVPGPSAPCCGAQPECGCEGDAVFGASLYDEASRDQVPDAAVLASLGCGNPTAIAELRPGETVLDLGSGGGIDVIISAKRVGVEGKAYGLDMTEEMLALARANAERAGVRNVEFLRGYIEDVPLPRESVDVVISNCVINLSPDKPKVFAEIARVLKPGGRIGIADVVADDSLDAAERAQRGSYVGCIAGALSIGEYGTMLREAGFADVSVTRTHDVADEMFSAIIRGTKPATAGTALPTERRVELQQARSCC